MNRAKLFTRKLKGGNIYHVYNQTNNKELMFLTTKDRLKFISNIQTYVAPFAHIFAYNLLSNHFHILLEVYEKEYLLRQTSKHFIEFLPSKCRHLVKLEENNMDEIMSNRFSSLFKSYAYSFNYHHKRSGNLFHRPFCRKLIDSDRYFKQAVYYIHANAVRHGITTEILDFDWTSYHSLVVDDTSLLSLEKMYDYFGGHDVLIDFHNKKQKFKKEKKFVIEERDLFKALNRQKENKKKKTSHGHVITA